MYFKTGGNFLNQIAMMRRVALLAACMLLTMCLWAQTRPISGKVVDSVGQPMVGVTVSITGNTKVRTLTDANGQFKLNVPQNTQSIVFSYVGFSPKTISILNKQTIEIAMDLSDSKLDDVVVTGFQRIDKKKFTGAAVKLTADDIRVPGATDVGRMLEGRAAGVSVQNVSSTFGSAPKIRIRGATSINGENKPLWVVDGVVLEDIVAISNDQLSSGDPTTLLGSSVAGINSNDIETFDILKDAAATALYGARAMNGVVVITTKRGRKGSLNINYTGNFTTQLKPQYTDYNIMNSGEQMSVLAELQRKGYLTSGGLAGRADYGMYGKMYQMIQDGDLLNTQESRKNFLLRYGKNNTDWFDILFRNSLAQEHSLSISSGSEKSQSFFSTSYYNDNGWTVADNVKRYTLNFRNNYTFSDRLTAGFLTTASVRQQRVPGTLNRSNNVVSGQYEREFDINPFSYALNTSRALTAYDENGDLEYFRRNWAPFNIIDELKNNFIDINVIDLKLQGELGYKISKHLRYDFVGALRYVKSTREHQITENSNMANAYRSNGTATIIEGNKYLYEDPDNPNATEKLVVLPYGGFYNTNENSLLNYDVRNSLNYNNVFNGKHTVSVLLGQQIKYTDRQTFGNTGYGYQYENGGVPFIDYRILKKTVEANFPYYSMNKSYDRFAAFYLNAQYTFDKKYNVYGTVRYDGSNQLGSSRTARWLPTWSFGGSWNLDQEKFIESIKAIDYLKFRVSYGLTASLGPATNSNAILSSQIPNRPFASERETVLNLTNLENADLTWEKNHQLNLGVDLGLFNDKVTMSVDWYRRNSFDLISLVKTSGIGGEAYKAINYADMKSTGVDVTLGGAVVKTKDWGWRPNITFGYNTTLITNVRNLPQIFNLVKAEGGNTEGYPVNSLFSLNYQGLDPVSGVPTFIDEFGKTSQAVNLQDERIGNLVYEGSIDPKFTGGLNNTVNYKSFTLNVFVTFQAGNKIRLYPAFRGGYGDLDAMPKEFYDRWMQIGDDVVPGVNPVINDPYYSYLTATTGGYPYNNYNYSTARVADGGFVRLKAVSLSYNLNAAAVKNLKVFKSLSLTAATQNLWLIYSDKKLKGQDPEFFNAGGVAQPVQKQVTLSVKAGF